MTGYCFGGGITWQAATELQGLKATAAFYGPAPGVDHAFHNDTGDRYCETQATAAWNDTLAWFQQHV